MAENNKMNTNELKLAQSKIQARSAFWTNLFITVRAICVCATVLWALHEILDGLQPLLDGKNAESIGAVAKVIQAFNLGSVLGYAWGVVATGAWAIERGRKK